jgi:hypothetical protein
MYNEASSTFYVNNTFTITKIQRHQKTDEENAFSMDATMSWLENLGSRVHLLRKLELDLEAMYLADVDPPFKKGFIEFSSLILFV